MDATLNKLLKALLNSVIIHNLTLAISSTKGTERQEHIDYGLETGFLTNEFVAVLNEESEEERKITKRIASHTNAIMEKLIAGDEEIRQLAMQLAPELMEGMIANYNRNHQQADIHVN